MAENNIILETRGLTKNFGGLVALDHVDFKLREGELRAIIGPNGAGKTTFLNVLTGRLPPTSGKVFFKGEDITGLPSYKITRKGIALSLQLVNIFPELTVFENVWVGAQMRFKACRNPFTKAESLTPIRRWVEEICRKVGLHDKMDEVASNLSHGDQKLLDIAIALSTEPTLLLLDEPLAGLSRKEFAEITEVIRELSKTKTIILIEHNIDAAMKLAHKITVLDRGRIIAEGEPSEISENAKVQEVYLGRRR
ncbi:MAG: ABC transporter ATP-binding protein [Candidatus Hecatellales archaeon]|nr:MAG: ABC transporter ATP-binding protein [Candidatus Hecatellales archaeon]